MTVNEAPSVSGLPADGAVNTGYLHTFSVDGFPAPALSLTAGTLPPGLSLVGYTLVGMPTAAGTFSGLTVTASNGVGSSATLDFSITVTNAPAITSTASTTFVVGTMSSFTVTATGTPAPTITHTGALPTGVTFTGGVLSGTPGAGTGGTYPLTFTASNGAGTDATQSFTLTVNQAPSVSGAPPSGTVGMGYMHTFTVGGFPVPTLSVTAGTLPPGVSLVGNTLVGMPTTAGTYGGLTLSASNGVGSPATLDFSITINSAPAITSTASTTFVVGTLGSFTVTATGTPAPTITHTGSLPTGVTFAGGVLSGTPAAGTGGIYPLTFTASNGVGSNAVQSFTLTVNQAPSLSGAPPSGTVGTSYSHAFTVDGFPAPTLSLTAGTLPPGLSLVGTSITGTPSMAGTYSGLTVSASNGVGSPATLNFSITINSAPAITSAASTTFVVGTMGSFTVTATGTPAPTITRTGTLPTGVTFTGGVLSGTPAAGTGGTYPLTFTASNGVGSNAVQSFTLTVNQAPSVSGAPPSGTLGTGYNHAFTVGGFPAPTLSLTAGTLPPGLSLVGNSITGTPSMAGTFAGLTVSASNGVGSPATLNFSITINSAPAITSGASTTFVVGTMGSFTVTATGTPAPTITHTGALPAGVTFAGGVLSGTPGAGTGGTYPLTFTASNGVGSNAMQSFTLTVNQAPSVSGAPPSGTVGTGYNHAFTVGGFPAPTLSLTAGTLPPGLSLVGNSITGTPSMAGTFAGLTVSASNGVGSPATLNFSIAIAGNPVAMADAYSVTGNIDIAVPAPGVLGNDTLSGGTLTHMGPLASTTTAVPGSITTSNGGSVTLAANGSFTYDPPAGYTGSDSFHYRLTSGANTSTAQVTLTITNRVWFVDSAGAAGDGRRSSPRNSLATAMSGAAAGDRIFVYQRPSNYVGNITLLASQRLIGQGVALDATSLGFAPATFSAALPVATSHTGIQGSVTFGGASAGLFGVHVTPTTGVGVTDAGVARTGLIAGNVRVTTSGGIGVSLTGSSGALSFRSVSTTGGTRGISLSGVGGTFAVTGDGSTAGSGGTIQNTTANGVQLTNTTAAVSLNYMALNGAVYDGVSLENSGCGVKLDATGSATGSLTINRSSFANNQGRSVYVHPTSSGSTAVTVTNSTFTTNTGSVSEVIAFFEGSALANTFDIRGNTFTNVGVLAVQVVLGTSVSPQQVARGHISNNVITGIANGFATGIAVGVNDNAGSTVVAAVENNMLSGMGTMAIDLNKQPLNSNMHVTVRNNTVRSPVVPGVNYLYGIRLTMASSSTAGPAGTYCANVTGNDIPSFGGTESAVRIRRLGTHVGLTTSFQGFTGNTEGQLTTFLTNANSGPFGSINYSPAPLTQFAFPNTTCLTP